MVDARFYTRMAPLCMFLIAVIGAVVIAAKFVPAHADGEAYPSFSENVGRLNSLILKACEKDKQTFLNTSDITGDLLNIHNLRRACGRGMNGQSLVGSPYKIFFQRDPDAGGALDFLGVTRKRTFGAHTYQLVVGWVTRRDEGSASPILRASYAEALLLRKNGMGWDQVWSYVNSRGDGWNRIEVESPTKYPHFSREEVAFVDRFWADALTVEFPDFIEKVEELTVE